MEREIRYCTTEDGVRIGYSVEGKGPPLLLTSLPFESYTLSREVEDCDKFVRRVSEGRTLVSFDIRGVGVSQKDNVRMTLEAIVADMEAVVRAAIPGPFSILSYGGTASTMTVPYAAMHPDGVAAIVLFAAVARVASHGDDLHNLAEMARSNWQMAGRTLAAVNMRRSTEVAAQKASILARSISGELAAQLLEATVGYSVVDNLPLIRARTLVIHSTGDVFYPFSAGQEVAAGIPNARLLPIEGNYSLTTLGDKLDLVVSAVNDFLNEDEGTRALPVAATARHTTDSVRTILWTDLVGHTEMMSRLGDERGRDVLREHERITREVLKANGGTEVKTMGDGFMASFGSVTKAVECAVALQRAFAEREGEPLNVRVGLNAGEPIEEDGDLFGATVILASRIAANADGGEILVADTVRGLCSGKGFLFADRGEFVAKGFEEPVRVYEVSWRDG